MPYADKQKKIAAYRKRYNADPDFRKAEAERKKVWYNKNLEANRARVREATARHRAKKKALKAAA